MARTVGPAIPGALSPVSFRVFVCCFMSFLNRRIVERYHISTPPSFNTDFLSPMWS